MVDRNPDTSALVDRLTRYDRAVEIGVGRRPDVASSLTACGVAVTATDIHPRPVPPNVRFVIDDVVDPDVSVYTDADVLYARHFPPELHRPARAVAAATGAPLLFTTLGGEEPTIPVDRYALETTTLYEARLDGPDRS